MGAGLIRARPGHLPAFDSPRRRPTAVAGRPPLRPSAGEPGQVPPEVADALAADQRVAYFTLGTVKNTDSADFEVALAALAEFDGVVIATTGRPLDPATLRSAPANVLFAEFVPQDAVLQRADLLVSHGGSGTMLGGLVHGIPQVALPRGTDQPQNAALLERAGAGVVVQPDDFAVDTVRAAIEEVTRDPSFRAAAERVRDEIAAMPDADTVWADLAVWPRPPPACGYRRVAARTRGSRAPRGRAGSGGHRDHSSPRPDRPGGSGRANPSARRRCASAPRRRGVRRQGCP